MITIVTKVEIQQQMITIVPKSESEAAAACGAQRCEASRPGAYRAAARRTTEIYFRISLNARNCMALTSGPAENATLIRSRPKLYYHKEDKRGFQEKPQKLGLTIQDNILQGVEKNIPK